MAILAEDVTFSLPPHPHWWRGRDDVIAAAVRSGLRIRNDDESPTAIDHDGP